MYSIVLVAALIRRGLGARPGCLPGSRRSEEIGRRNSRRGRTSNRSTVPKQTIGELRQRLIEQRLEALHRAVQELKAGGASMKHPAIRRLPLPPPRAVVHVRMPAGAKFYANDREMPLLSPDTVFATPPPRGGERVLLRLQGGRPSGGQDRHPDQTRRYPPRHGSPPRLRGHEGGRLITAGIGPRRAPLEAGAWPRSHHSSHRRRPRRPLADPGLARPDTGSSCSARLPRTASRSP